MDQRTQEALEGSIRKWQRIAAGEIRDEGTANCPLCQLFNNISSDPMCHGCPVYERTGRVGCDGTPYHDFADKSQAGFARSPSAKRLAKEEIGFLISLRPHA